MENLTGSSLVAAILSLAGVLITALLTTLTALRSGRDRRERNTERRRIEEETTDVILKRVRAELDRAYETIDIKDRQLHHVRRFLSVNRRRFETLGISVPEIDVDEGPTLSEDISRIRYEIDRDAADEYEVDRLVDRDRDSDREDRR